MSVKRTANLAARCRKSARTKRNTTKNRIVAFHKRAENWKSVLADDCINHGSVGTRLLCAFAMESWAEMDTVHPFKKGRAWLLMDCDISDIDITGQT